MSVLTLLLVATAAVGTSGLVALAPRRGDQWSHGALVLGCVAGALGALGVLANGPLEASIPGGPSVRVDAVGALFLLQTFLLSAVASAYGLTYWPSDRHPSGRRVRVAWGATTAGLAGVFCAGDGMTFIVAWEVMALAAFFALTAEDHDPGVREAGRLYLYCTRAGTLALIVLFTWMHLRSGSWALVAQEGAPWAILALALFGFGLKAGAVPLHLWLPGAHASAPSHVSALMSGVLIKAGIYGLIRVLGLYAGAPVAWGAVVLAMGAASSVLGVAFAIGQHDLKRLLAWHSVENIGIILLGLGLALAARSDGHDGLAAIALAGALLHTWNHGIFKSLLFLAAGAVIHGSGLRTIDRMGGLARRMPGPALMFLVGAAAICGLPPLNGFVSEFLVYSGLLRLLLVPAGASWLLAPLGVAALAMTGALALLCFAKVYGVAFSGEPRSAEAAAARDAPRPMTGAMAVLAGLCVLFGLAPVLAAPALDRAVAAWGLGAAPLVEELPLGALAAMATGLAVALLLAGLLLRARLKGHITAGVTWDCGYAAPTARMQYTASSFADTVVALMGWALAPKRSAEVGPAFYQPGADVHSHVRDLSHEAVARPAWRATSRLLGRMHAFQRGSLHAGILYILLALLLAFLL